MSKDEIIAEKEQKIQQLQSENAYLKKMIFGSKSERYHSELDDNQLNLFEQIQEEQSEPIPETETITYDREKKKHPGRHKIPDHLPVETIIIEPHEDISGLKKIGEEITETLKYTPASLVCIRYIRPKYEQKEQQGVLIAPMPDRAIHKCIAEDSLLAHIMVAKFVDHLPFYRQIKRFKRDFDWVISSSTINDWFIACCTLLQPIYDEMVNQIRTSDYIQVDESPIKVLESEKKKKSHQGYQWVYHAPEHQTIVFNYRKGRGKQGPKEFLVNYQGYLQCDGYSVYDKIGTKKGIELVGCLVHARRYFHEALDNDKASAEYALKSFKSIYELERNWKEDSDEQRYRKRQEQIKPQLEQLLDWSKQKILKTTPKSKIGQALGYYIRQYPKLIAVTQSGKLKLDNNLIENKIRPLALGRKNFLFAGSHDAAQRIAIMYTMFATCKAKNVNPREWLTQTLNILADKQFVDYKSLIP